MPFEKGKVSNPHGASKQKRQKIRELRHLFKQKTVKKAVEAIEQSLDDPDTRLTAAKMVLECVYGKPTQIIATEDGTPLVAVIRDA